MAGIHHFGAGSVSEDHAEVGLGFYEAVVIALQGGETKEMRDILTIQMPLFLELFIQKNKEYGENAQTLGPRGQFADIWRKIAKLKTGLWDGEEDKLTSEGVDEILRDLIGHCFLILSMRDRERKMFAEGADLERDLREAQNTIGGLKNEMRSIVRRLPSTRAPESATVSQEDIKLAFPRAWQLLKETIDRDKKGTLVPEDNEQLGEDFLDVE